MRKTDSFALHEIAVNAEFEIIVILTEMNSCNKNKLWSRSKSELLILIMGSSYLLWLVINKIF